MRILRRLPGCRGRVTSRSGASSSQRGTLFRRPQKLRPVHHLVLWLLEGLTRSAAETKRRDTVGKDARGYIGAALHAEHSACPLSRVADASVPALGHGSFPLAPPNLGSLKQPHIVRALGGEFHRCASGIVGATMAQFCSCFGGTATQTYRSDQFRRPVS